MAPAIEPILRVENLRTYFNLRTGILKAVDGVSFAVEPGKVLCIVGESGSGKSVTALSILRLVDAPAASRAAGSSIATRTFSISPKRK